MSSAGKGREIAPAGGKLGVLLPGMGAVATTFIAGVEAVAQGLAKPIGSLTQMGTIRLGKRTDDRSPLIKDFVPLAALDDLVFGGWDIFPTTPTRPRRRRACSSRRAPRADQGRPGRRSSRWPAVFDPEYVKKLNGPNVKKGKIEERPGRAGLATTSRASRRRRAATALVAVWCGSTEVYREPGDVHSTLEKFEKGLDDERSRHRALDDLRLRALKAGVPYANGAPNLSARHPGAARAREEDRARRSAARTSRPARR